LQHIRTPIPLGKQFSPRKHRTRRIAIARSERGHQEVRDKLYAWGLHRAEVEDAIGRLIVATFSLYL
jgi:hypothetical protein